MAGTPDGATAFLGSLVAAIATVSVAFIGRRGVRTERRRTVRDADAEMVTVLVNDLRAEITHLRAENARLRRELERRRR